MLGPHILDSQPVTSRISTTIPQAGDNGIEKPVINASFAKPRFE